MKPWSPAPWTVGGLVDGVGFVEVDRATDVAFEAGVEQARGVRKRGALGESHLHDALIRLAGANNAVVLPNRNAAPFYFFDDCLLYTSFCARRKLPDNLNGS